MPVMQCVACGMEARPKSYHPSSLRVEVGVWLVAVLVGLAVGVVSTVKGPAANAGGRMAAFAALAAASVDAEVKGPVADSGERMAALSAVAAASGGAETARVAEDHAARSSPTLQVSNWIRAKVGLFLRSAWWVLPIPVLFSLWRQNSKRDGCPKCGARKLIPAPEEAWS